MKKTALQEYCEKVLSGKITACRRLRQTCEKLLWDLDNPSDWHFDAELAEKHIAFIERFCKTPSGQLGAPLKLELYQKARLQAIYGFVDGLGIRKYQEVLIIEGRKNGKTTECAAVELDQLVNTAEGAPQVYNVATARDQANLGFSAALKMMYTSPLLSSHLKKRQSDIFNPMNFGFIKPLASNTNTLDGLDTQCAVIDELSAIKNRDIYDLIRQSTGARRQPLIFTISTNGFIRNGIFDAQYQYACDILDGKAQNERFLPFIYELDSPDEWDKEEAWVKANPGLGTIKSKDYLRSMVRRAKDDASFKPTVMVKDFNIKQTSESAWLRYEELNNESKYDIPFKYCIGGFDAADTTDLNAAKAIMMRPNDPNLYVRSMYWLPESVLEERRQKGLRTERDSAPYELWIQQGLMRTCPGNRCDKKIFIEWFSELREQEHLYPTFIGYDPWHIGDAELREFQSAFGKNVMVPVRQGTISLSEPMKELASEFKLGHVVYNNNPIDKWCLINTGVKTDVNGNIQPVKALAPTQRIDGTAALLDAYKVLRDNKDRFIGLNSGVKGNS